MPGPPVKRAPSLGIGGIFPNSSYRWITFRAHFWPLDSTAFLPNTISSCCKINLEEIGFGNNPVAVFIGINLFDSSNSGIATMFLFRARIIAAVALALLLSQKSPVPFRLRTLKPCVAQALCLHLGVIVVSGLVRLDDWR